MKLISFNIPHEHDSTTLEHIHVRIVNDGKYTHKAKHNCNKKFKKERSNKKETFKASSRKYNLNRKIK